METTASFSEGSLDPCDRPGDRLVGRPETPRKRPVAHPKLPKLQGFPSDRPVDRPLCGLDQRHLEWCRRRGWNTLRPGPPTPPLLPMGRIR